MILMGILSKGIEKVHEFGARRREQAEQRLLKDTKDQEREFASEAKKLGIDVSGADRKDYYSALGLKYTNDQKAIRDSYFSLVKKYHPDVNKSMEATRRTVEINEAYAVLKDKKKKAQYDVRSSKGGSALSEDVSRHIANAFLKCYSEMRDKDFGEFNKRVAVPQYADSIKAAIEEVADWSKRFGRAESRTFGRLRDCGARIRHTVSINRSLLKGEQTDSRKEALMENLARLEVLEKSYIEIDKGISAVMAKIREEIAGNENSIADRLRRSIQ